LLLPAKIFKDNINYKRGIQLGSQVKISCYIRLQFPLYITSAYSIIVNSVFRSSN